MLTANTTASVSDANGFRRMFAPGCLTLGVFFPIESFQRDEPTMRNQERLARRAEELGFAALWVRDVPLRDPHFGDVGQVYDPWGYLGWIAAQTHSIALATGSIVLPLRHPLHTAKAAASIDQLSHGRLVLGVATGDREVEYPAFGINFDERDALFRENLRIIRIVLEDEFPRLQSSHGVLFGTADVVPKPVGRIPIFVTGGSGQHLEWIAENADGWISYPRPVNQQAQLVARWRTAVEAFAPGTFKPFAQSLFIDLTDDPNQMPEPIHLGLRAGRNVVFTFLDSLRAAGVNHVALNLKYARRDAAEILEEIGREILPMINNSQPHEVNTPFAEA